MVSFRHSHSSTPKFCQPQVPSVITRANRKCSFIDNFSLQPPFMGDFPGFEKRIVVLGAHKQKTQVKLSSNAKVSVSWLMDWVAIQPPIPEEKNRTGQGCLNMGDFSKHPSIKTRILLKAPSSSIWIWMFWILWMISPNFFSGSVPPVLPCGQRGTPHHLALPWCTLLSQPRFPT